MASDDIYMNNMTKDVSKDSNDYLYLGQTAEKEEGDVYDIPHALDSPQCKPVHPAFIDGNEKSCGPGTTKSAGISLSSKTVCWTIVVVLIVIVVSNSMTGIGVFLWREQACTGKGSHIICPSVAPSTSSSIAFDCPQTIRFPDRSLTSIIYAKDNSNYIRSISSSVSRHTLDDFDVGTTQVSVTAQDIFGNKESCSFLYYRVPDPVVICPCSEVDGYDSVLAFGNPSVYNFPNTSDVTVSYLRPNQDAITIPWSTSEHTISNFTVGLTVVNLTAVDSASNKAACSFTYTRKPAPAVVCPSIPKAKSSTVRFERPDLKNFPHDELVQYSYLKHGVAIASFAATTQHHELNGFDGGTTLVTTVANDSYNGIVASCEFRYYRVPEILCPGTTQSTSTSLSFSRPEANFIVKSPYYYSWNGELFRVISPLITNHQLVDIPRAQTATVSVSVAGDLGYGAFCNLRVDPHEGSVRLVNGANRYQGRVEINHNGVWGTVCDDGWDALDAAVVCRQLGLPHEETVYKCCAYFGQGSEQIWLDDVGCSGRETRLDTCSHRGWGILSSCSHSEDAGVICSDVDIDTTAKVRLIDGRTPYEGRVEIYHNHVWGSVCDAYWTTADAIVVCRQLGFSYGAVEARGSSQFGHASGQVWLDQISCNGSESYLSNCIHAGWGITSSQCSDHSQDVGVICKDGQNYVRLVDGSNGFDGRVEIMHNGEWGSICSNNWDVNEAVVVCRQLGLPYGATEAPVNATFGKGIGEIWMDEVHCDGSEDELSECVRNAWGNHTCGHDQDAGIICK